MIVFGPVPSRRLGYSLGINHIPPKHCPYSCVYCQVGRTTRLEITRSAFYPLERILTEVEHKISDSRSAGRAIDYLTLVPDGEPTQDVKLGELIKGLKAFNIPVAVISNAALIDDQVVQDDLMLADWVSLKVDAVRENDWRLINRPHRGLSLPSILKGIHVFRGKFQGVMVTETMLVSGLNDSAMAIQVLMDYLLELKPVKSYLSLPIRPPAENWVKSPDAERLQTILNRMSEKIPFLELMFESEGTDFASTGDIAEDIISTTAVHPLREGALQNMVSQAGENWAVVEQLIRSNKISSIQYRGETFYLNNMSHLKKATNV